MSLRLEIILVLLTWIAFIATHQVFLYFDFFWLFWWSDILLHIWGGGLLVASWYLVERMYVFPRTMALKLNHPLLILLVVMIGWEVFEYVFGVANNTSYVSDTIQDFIFGALGGLVAFWVNKSRTIKDI